MTTSAVITLVMDAMGRTWSAFLAHSTWPVVASTRIPAFALTAFGAPAIAMAGPAGTVALWLAAGAVVLTTPTVGLAGTAGDETGEAGEAEDAGEAGNPEDAGEAGDAEESGEAAEAEEPG